MAEHKMEQRLDASVISKAALQLMNEVGMSGVTMRRLAAALDMQGPSLYWHFRNKSELLGAMKEQLIDETLRETVTDEGDWSDWLAAYGRSLWQVLNRYRDGAHLMASAPVTARVEQELIPVIYQRVTEGGLPRSTAIEAASSVNSLTLGWAIYEQTETAHSLMHSLMNVEHAFNAGLAALLLGLRHNHQSDR